MKKIIIEELEDVAQKYAEPRRTDIVYVHELPAVEDVELPEDYAVNVFLSRHGYFKKITPLSLRMGGEQKYKEEDGPSQSFESMNNSEIMFFTDRAQVYKTRLSEFEDTKASALGDYLPAKLGMDSGENVVAAVLPGDYKGSLLFFFENGKVARIELSAYQTVSNRRRLTGAYSDKSPLVSIMHLTEDREVALYSTEPRVLIFHTALLAPKTTRSSQGVAVLTLKKKHTLARAAYAEETGIANLSRYRGRSIPATGALLKEEDSEEKQLSLLGKDE